MTYLKRADMPVCPLCDEHIEADDAVEVLTADGCQALVHAACMKLDEDEENEVTGDEDDIDGFDLEDDEDD